MHNYPGMLGNNQFIIESLLQVQIPKNLTKRSTITVNIQQGNLFIKIFKIYFFR